MCGIIGYIGNRGATSLLLEGLKRMEYRGYDSAGVAVMNGNGVETRKTAGKISNLERSLAASPVQGDTGIGHTRWATHGVPNERNAHPHIDCKGEIAVVHNGIIENSGTLRLGPGSDRARRLRSLHAQGNLRAAGDHRELHARATAAGSGHVEAWWPQHDRRGATEVRQHPHHRLRHELALGFDRRTHARESRPRSRRS